MTFVLQIFDFRIIGDLLTLQASTHAVNKANDDSLLVRTSFLYDNKLAKVKFSRTFPNLQYIFTKLV